MPEVAVGAAAPGSLALRLQTQSYERWVPQGAPGAAEQEVVQAVLHFGRVPGVKVIKTDRCPRRT